MIAAGDGGPDWWSGILLTTDAEKKDGKKAYDAAPHSQEMTAMNKRFSILHGVSSALNLVEFFALLGYGFTLAARVV